MSPRVLKATGVLRDFLFERVYDVQSALPETERARQVIRFLYAYFLKHPQALPPEYLLHCDTEWRGVVDYIANMTDQYALKTAEELALLTPQASHNIFSKFSIQAFPFQIVVLRYLSL